RMRQWDAYMGCVHGTRTWGRVHGTRTWGRVDGQTKQGRANMHASEVKRLAEGLLGVALSAGRVQMAHFKRGVRVERKSDQSPVPAADREAEELILKELARVAPGIPVVAEEQCASGQTPAPGGSFFLVDPLDGTRGFIKGRAEFTINIALIEERRP